MFFNVLDTSFLLLINVFYSEDVLCKETEILEYENEILEF